MYVIIVIDFVFVCEIKIFEIIAPKDVYEGEFKCGNRHGRGAFIYSSSTGANDIYDGEWKDDMRHGSGVFTYGASGKVLKGTWKENEWQGEFVFGLCFICPQ